VRDILILAIHLPVTLAKFLRPGGVRAVAAESLLLKHQLLISNRSRQRRPISRPSIASSSASPRRKPGPSWLTFIAQAKDSLWSVDLFRCESILLHSHWVLVVIDVFTRRTGFASIR
jgi:hypothetical protein